MAASTVEDAAVGGGVAGFGGKLFAAARSGVFCLLPASVGAALFGLVTGAAAAGKRVGVSSSELLPPWCGVRVTLLPCGAAGVVAWSAAWAAAWGAALASSSVDVVMVVSSSCDSTTERGVPEACTITRDDLALAVPGWFPQSERDFGGDAVSSLAEERAGDRSRFVLGLAACAGDLFFGSADGDSSVKS